MILADAAMNVYLISLNSPEFESFLGPFDVYIYIHNIYIYTYVTVYLYINIHIIYI